MLAAGVCVVMLLHAPMLLMETLLMSFRIAFLVQVTSDVCGLSASVDVFICRFVRINRTNACELNVHRSALQVAAETIAQYGAEDAVARLVALSLGYASKIPRVRPLSAPPLLRAHVRNTCAPASPPTEVNGSHACHAAPTLCWRSKPSRTDHWWSMHASVCVIQRIDRHAFRVAERVGHFGAYGL